MPLIEPKSTCKDFAKLNFAAQNFYWTLRTHLDPMGRHLADPDILVSTLFPLKRSHVRRADISRWLAECQKAGVLRCYADTKGRACVEVKDGVQRMKNQSSKLEGFDGGQASLPLEVPGVRCGVSGDPPPPKPKGRGAKCQVSGMSETEVNRIEEKENAGAHEMVVEKSSPEAAIPSLKEVLDYAAMHSVPEASARAFYTYHEDKNLWLNRHDRMINWKSSLMTWAANDRQPKPNLINGPIQNNRPGAPDRIAGTHNEGRNTDALSRKVR